MTDSVDSENDNLLSGHRISLDGGTLANCNMVSLTPFLKETLDSTVAVRRGYEAALAKILAIQHLNTGDGSLISEINGLNERCPIRFNIDFVDTKLNIGTAATRLARRMINTDVPPCVFLGSTLSIVSATTSKFTASNGYPQISGTSTSSFLDNVDDYPLFSRTTPSTKGHSRALIRYLKEEVGVDNLAMIYIADPYGYHYVEDLKEAIIDYEINDTRGDERNKFDLEAFSLLPDLSNLREAMEFVKSTKFQHVFVAYYGEYLNDHSIMEEAISHGIAGSKSNTTWLFGDDFLAPQEWVFDSSNPLVDAYKSTGLFTAGGKATTINPESSRYREFTKKLNALKPSRVPTGSVRSASAPKKTSKSSDKGRKNHDSTTLLTRQYQSIDEASDPMNIYFEKIISDPVDKDLAMDYWEELLLDDTFLHPDFLTHDIPYEYEAVVMAGLALCNSVKNTEIENTLFVNGETFQNELVNISVDGITGTVTLDPKTGTRLENSTYYAIQNLIPQEFEDDEQKRKTRFWKMQSALLEPIVAISGDKTSGRSDENWVSMENNTHNNGMIPLLPDIPDAIRTPPPSIPNTQHRSPISIDENDYVRLIQGLSCLLSVSAALGCLIWTCSCRDQPIVRASKPLFLYLICGGVILFASAIIPFSIVGTSAVLEDTDNNGEIIREEFLQLMNSLCSATIWLRTLGFAVIVSALFSKTYRFDKVVCGIKLYQTSRARVMIDFLIPLVGMLTVNILILSLMTGLYPVTYGIIPYDDPSDDAIHAYESCNYTADHRNKFWIPLIGWNISVLVYSLRRSWSARNCEIKESPHFPSERPHIFNALLITLLMSLWGIMIMLLVQDRDDPITSALVEATISFFFCVFVLFAVFSTKIKHVWRTFSIHEAEMDSNIAFNEHETASGLQQNSHHLSRSSHSATKNQLKTENDDLRKRNLELEEELAMNPRRIQSKSQVLKNFFGSFLGTDDRFDDEYTLTPTIESKQPQKQKEENHVHKNHQHQQSEDLEKLNKAPQYTVTSEKRSRFPFKKIVDDIFFVSSDIIPSYSPDIRPVTLSAETTSWSLSREYRSFKSNLRSSTSSSKNKKSSYNNSSIYLTTSSSPESKNKSSPATKSTPTSAKSDLIPRRSSYYKSPEAKRRGPEVEDYSTAPLVKNVGSFGSSIAPLGGTPPNAIEKNGYHRNSLAFSESPLENALKPRAQQTRNAMRNSFDSSMMPLGDRSATPSLSTGMEAKPVFRPKRLSGGVDRDGYLVKKSEHPGGIPSHIIIWNYDDPIEEDVPPPTTLLPATPEALPYSPPPVPRRPSVGYDMDIKKEPQNPYRHFV